MFRYQGLQTSGAFRVHLSQQKGKGKTKSEKHYLSTVNLKRASKKTYKNHFEDCCGCIDYLIKPQEDSWRSSKLGGHALMLCKAVCLS